MDSMWRLFNRSLLLSPEFFTKRYLLFGTDDENETQFVRLPDTQLTSR
jgi:hypothetical protein